MSFLSRIFGSSPVRLSQQLGAYPLPSGDIGPLYVFFGIENVSRQEIEISGVRVIPKGKDEPLGIELKGEVPTTITPGGNVRCEVRAKTLASASRAAGHTGTPKLTFAATDGEGNEHCHDFTLRVDEYLSLKDE